MLDVIYEDNDVAVLNKPAGVSVHPAPHRPDEKTLVNEIVERWPEIKDIGEDALRPGIVHRLDKETSGILVVAKNQQTFLHLKKQFQERKISKKYIALAVGKMPQKRGEISYAIGRSRKFGKFTVKNPRAKNREAVTKWRVVREYKDASGQALSLLELVTETGRTHQIRVHLAAIGHPVVGDNLYGGNAARRYRDALSRHFLHAEQIELTLPSGARFRAEAPLPKELQNFLKQLI